MQAGVSTVDTLSAKCSSPRLVIYKSHTLIASAFVIAGKNLWVKIKEPTVAKSVTSLLVAYYVWHVAYPPAYSNTLTFLDQEILETRKHNVMVVHKLTRDLENIKNSLG